MHPDWIFSVVNASTHGAVGVQAGLSRDLEVAGKLTVVDGQPVSAAATNINARVLAACR